ncbi:MAG: hypothetical protein JW827_08990 [Spirochaetes bacterium]|nr:hypothetical protein [Spirochaetota bacterium]
MKHFAGLLLIILMLFLSCGKKAQDVSQPTDLQLEDSLLGSWETIQGDAENILFEKEGDEKRYSSFLHQRPFYVGTWNIDKGQLILVLSEGEEKVIYQKVFIQDNILHLVREDGQEEKYRRINE